MISRAVNELAVKETTTLKEAMERINNTARGIIYAVDDSGRLVGSLTDGDVRRWILKGGEIGAPVNIVMHRDVKYSRNRDYTINIEFMKKFQVMSMPVVDENNVLIDIQFANSSQFDDENPVSSILNSIDVIVMAGGKGTRLYPYTKILPKPLIPIGDQPVLERILYSFFKYGAEHFYITVNYKREMIKAYFAETKPPYTIKYIDETVPLGTAGGISMIKDRLSSPVIITNCDILLECDYEEMMKYHYKSGNDMTIISATKTAQIPYGVLKCNKEGYVVSMEEKPKHEYYINTGLYIINPDFLKWIPRHTIFHMTDLAKQLIENNKKIGMYTIDENAFFDMGEFEGMKRMEDYISQRYAK